MKEKIDRAIKNKELFFIGSKLPDDFYSAFLEWSALAEKNNDPKAFYNIAWCYMHGEGTDKNVGLAVDNYNKALSSGINEAAGQLYILYGKNSLEYQIGIFTENEKKETAEEYKVRLQKLSNLLDGFMAKGLPGYETKKQAVETLIHILDLHLLFLKNHDEFKKGCVRLEDQGYSWAGDLRNASECSIISVQKFTAKRNAHEVIRDGNTTFIRGDKYYEMAHETYFDNVTDAAVTIAQGTSPTTIPPKQKSRFQFGRFDPPVKTKDTEVADVFTRGRAWITIVRLPQINASLGFDSTVETLSLDLPVKKEKYTEEIPVSGFNKVGIFVLVAFILGCVFFFSK